MKTFIIIAQCKHVSEQQIIYDVLKRNNIVHEMVEVNEEKMNVLPGVYVLDPSDPRELLEAGAIKLELTELKDGFITCAEDKRINEHMTKKHLGPQIVIAEKQSIIKEEEES